MIGEWLVLLGLGLAAWEWGMAAFLVFLAVLGWMWWRS